MKVPLHPSIVRPTLLVDRTCAERDIQRMAEKAVGATRTHWVSISCIASPRRRLPISTLSGLAALEA